MTIIEAVCNGYSKSPLKPPFPHEVCDIGRQTVTPSDATKIAPPTKERATRRFAKAATKQTVAINPNPFANRHIAGLLT